jgi:hypothetical protein
VTFVTSENSGNEYTHFSPLEDIGCHTTEAKGYILLICYLNGFKKKGNCLFSDYHPRLGKKENRQSNAMCL